MGQRVEISKISDAISGARHPQLKWFCPSVLVHKGITIVLSLFRNHWLAVVYCLVLCSGFCEPVHEDRTRKNPRSMYARVPQVQVQFVLKIEKISHIIGQPRY